MDLDHTIRTLSTLLTEDFDIAVGAKPEDKRGHRYFLYVWPPRPPIIDQFRILHHIIQDAFDEVKPR